MVALEPVGHRFVITPKRMENLEWIPGAGGWARQRGGDYFLIWDPFGKGSRR